VPDSLSGHPKVIAYLLIVVPLEKHLDQQLELSSAIFFDKVLYWSTHSHHPILVREIDQESQTPYGH
jgi:hypothetical protein